MAPPRNLAADLMNILMHSPKVEEAYGEYLSWKAGGLSSGFRDTDALRQSVFSRLGNALG